MKDGKQIRSWVTWFLVVAILLPAALVTTSDAEAGWRARRRRQMRFARRMAMMQQMGAYNRNSPGGPSVPPTHISNPGLNPTPNVGSSVRPLDMGNEPNGRSSNPFGSSTKDPSRISQIGYSPDAPAGGGQRELQRVNEARANEGLHALEFDPALYRTALQRATAMAKAGHKIIFGNSSDHDIPGGTNWTESGGRYEGISTSTDPRGAPEAACYATWRTKDGRPFPISAMGSACVNGYCVNIYR